MSLRLDVEDLQLVDAVGRHGSVGAAARELLLSQPSASRRLAALERRLDTVLFDRDTTGARATATGRELARHAGRLLSELEALPEHVLAAAVTPTLVAGTIASLSPMVFTALEIELDGLLVVPEIDHGPALIRRVARGTLDAAFVTIAEQTVIPRGLTRSLVGESPLVLVLPGGAEPPAARGRRPLAGRTVFYYAVDLAGEDARERLAALGARPRPGATMEATMLTARHRRCPALVPEFAARWYAAGDDQIVRSPLPGRVTVSLVTRPPQPSALVDVLPALRRHILDGWKG